MKIRGFNQQTIPTEEQILTLQTDREKSKETIRALRAEIRRLEELEKEADDLDREIFGLERQAKTGILQAEMDHFRDLGSLITRLQKIRIIDGNRQTLKELSKISGSIDLEQMTRDEDELEARRSLMREELA